jgi:hypothetical protein
MRFRVAGVIAMGIDVLEKDADATWERRLELKYLRKEARELLKQ